MENFTFYAVLFIEIKKGKSSPKDYWYKARIFIWWSLKPFNIILFFPYLNSDYYLHYYYPDKN